jgi:hypothetical protein
MTDRLDGQHPSHDQRSDASHTSAQKAALEAVSPTLLMPGEEDSSPYIEDAEHWIAVYSELYNFTVAIVNRLRTDMLDLQQPTQDYLRTHDVLVHEEQIRRFSERLAFWNQRLAQLRAKSGRHEIAAS